MEEKRLEGRLAKFAGETQRLAPAVAQGYGAGQQSGEGRGLTRLLTGWEQQGWPLCAGVSAKMGSLRWGRPKKSREPGGGGGGRPVRLGGVWRLVSCRGGEVRGQVFPSAWSFLPLHRGQWLSTSVSPEKISFDSDFKGFSNLGKSTRALLCVAEIPSLLGGGGGGGF